MSEEGGGAQLLQGFRILVDNAPFRVSVSRSFRVLQQRVLAAGQAEISQAVPLPHTERYLSYASVHYPAVLGRHGNAAHAHIALCSTLAPVDSRARVFASPQTKKNVRLSQHWNKSHQADGGTCAPLRLNEITIMCVITDTRYSFITATLTLPVASQFHVFLASCGQLQMKLNNL